MAFFPLPHTATITHRIASPIKSRSGQVALATEYETTSTDVKCLFYGYMGGKTTNAREDYDQTGAFYCGPTEDIREGDKITNIIGVVGFEDGPFEVLKVTKVTNFSGNVHHLSCKIKGSSS